MIRQNILVQILFVYIVLLTVNYFLCVPLFIKFLFCFIIREIRSSSLGPQEAQNLQTNCCHDSMNRRSTLPERKKRPKGRNHCRVLPLFQDVGKLDVDLPAPLQCPYDEPTLR